MGILNTCSIHVPTTLSLYSQCVALEMRGHQCPSGWLSRPSPRSARYLSGDVVGALPPTSRYPAQDVRNVDVPDAHTAAQHVCKFDRRDSYRQRSIEDMAVGCKHKDVLCVEHYSRILNDGRSQTSAPTIGLSFGANVLERRGYMRANASAKTWGDFSAGSGGLHPENRLPTSENYVHDRHGVPDRVRWFRSGPGPCQSEKL